MLKPSRRTNIIIYIALIFVISLALMPILWGFSTSLKPHVDTMEYPPQWIPKEFTIENYIEVFHAGMPRFFLNSAVYAIGTIFVALFVGIHAAYVAAKVNFRFKNVIFFIILMAAMVPGVAMLPGYYMVSQKMGLHDTYICLILVYSAWLTPPVIWLLRGFFETIPYELVEAAMIDGSTQLGALYRIGLRIAQPGIAAAAIFIFVNVWNDFLFSVTLTTSATMRSTQVGLYNYWGDTGLYWGRFMAYSIMSIMPVAVVFLISQKRFIEGLTAGSVKG
jgi:ABC-type glycerol-3-phosphate transport system permease component